MPCFVLIVLWFDVCRVALHPASVHWVVLKQYLRFSFLSHFMLLFLTFRFSNTLAVHLNDFEPCLLIVDALFGLQCPLSDDASWCLFRVVNFVWNLMLISLDSQPLMFASIYLLDCRDLWLYVLCVPMFWFSFCKFWVTSLMMCCLALSYTDTIASCL